MTSYLREFEDLSKDDVATAGGKGANLGELSRAGFPVPAGFVLTTAAYDAFVTASGITNAIVGLATLSLRHGRRPTITLLSRSVRCSPPVRSPRTWCASCVPPSPRSPRVGMWLLP
jgi:hypothetical protein